MEFYSPSLFRALNGVFCIYKPAGKSNKQILEAIKLNLSRELNNMQCRSPRLRPLFPHEVNKYLISNTNGRNLVSLEQINKNEKKSDFNDIKTSEEYSIENNFDENKIIEHNELELNNKSQDVQLTNTDSLDLNSNATIKIPDLADHPLVVGPRYINEDFKLYSANPMKTFSSGVTLVGIDSGTSIIRPITEANYMRVYHVSGKLGLATQDFTPTGRIIEQSTFDHVTRERLDRVISGIQAGHQRHMFSAAGVDLESEEAYEMACKGLLRPTDPRYGPVLYGVRCIHFKKPDFIIEVHAINETCTYLMKLVHELGLELRTNAVCAQLRRIRYGQFTLRHALLFPKHTTASFIADNIRVNRALLNDVCHTANIKNLAEEDFQVKKKLDIRKDIDSNVFVNLNDVVLN